MHGWSCQSQLQRPQVQNNVTWQWQRHTCVREQPVQGYVRAIDGNDELNGGVARADRLQRESVNAASTPAATLRRQSPSSRVSDRRRTFRMNYAQHHSTPHTYIKKVKVNVAHTRLPSVWFRSWSRFLAVSLQVTRVINPAVGCHYFLPGPQ